MIQVCSQCGTRWNVRDRQRAWCPRCNGALLPPSVPAPQWSAPPPAAPPSARAPQQTPPRIPAGYRWIAVRPGAAPPARRRRRPLGPTPRYTAVPRWGLVEHFDAAETPLHAVPRGGPSVATVRTVLIGTMAVLGAAALVHVVRYGLLLINRTVLLNPVVAWLATWLGYAVSAVALVAVLVSVIVLTNWLIARRAAAFARFGCDDPRPAWMVRAGCWIPPVNLAWAPVFALELAAVENRSAQLRRPIVVWWIGWTLSCAVSVYASATRFAGDAQGIADNTVVTTVAYLLALAALLLATQVFLGFERTSVERVPRRWVIVAGESSTAAERPPADRHPQPESPVSVEAAGQNPAA